MNLSPIQILAIAKAVKPAQATKSSKGLSVGSHDFSVTVTISGTLNKGEDYEQNVPAKADSWGLLALALSKLNGVTVESLTKDFVAFSPENIKEVKKQAENAIQALKNATVSNCVGKITIPEMQVELIEIPEVKKVPNLLANCE